MANLRVGTGITFDGATGNFNTLGIGTVRGAFNATGVINATGAINASSGLNVGSAVTISSNGNLGITGICTATSFSGIVGGLTPITSTTVSSSVSAVSFTEALTGAFDTYKIYVVTMAGVRCDADDRDLQLRVRHGSNGGTLYSNSDYLSMTNGPSADDSFSAASQWRMNYNNIGNESASSYMRETFNAIIYFYGFEANRRLRYHGQTTYQSSDGNIRGQFINGTATDATEVTGLEFFSSSGNINLGKFSLFGVNG